MTSHSLPRVAIIGRPNVGKSTLFNRLCGKKLAIVDDTPGVTRDWREARARLFDMPFMIVDTPGLDGFENPDLKSQIMDQTRRIIDSSDALLFVVDGRDGLLGSDEELAHLVRVANKPVVLLVNKAEGSHQDVLNEALSLGIGATPIGFSALQGNGVDDLYEALQEAFEGFDFSDVEEEEAEPTHLQVAIFGRPNAGKSTLINALLGHDRVVVGDQPGITRDAIRIDWTYEGRALRLIDTAGVRRRSKVTDVLERLSVRDAMQAVRYSHVSILVVDALSPLDKQDLLLAGKIIDEGRALVIAINKWDRDEKESFDEIKYKVQKSLAQAKGVPIIPISALRGKNLDRLMKAVFEMDEHWNARIPTAELNRWLEEATTRHPLPLVGSTRVRIKYATQIKTRPPTIALFVSKPKDLPDSYLRYLTTSLREDFNLPGVPIRLVVRKGKNPYATVES